MNSGQLGQLLSLAIIAAAFYFLMIRPQMKRQKDHQQLVESLAVGDRVVTIGGVFGTIASLEEGRVGIEVSKGVVVEFDRGAVARKVQD